MSTATTNNQSRNPFRSRPISAQSSAQSTHLNPNLNPSTSDPVPPPVDVPDLSPAQHNADEAPPAYTLSADPSQGETTVEFGPRRPFQQVAARPQHRPQQQHLSPQSTAQTSPPPQSTSIWQQLASAALSLSSPQQPRRPSSAGSNVPPWSSYPGNDLPSQPQRHAHQDPASSLRIPPPRHPQSPSRASAPATVSSAPSSRPTSEFARDFYAAGPDASVAALGVAPAASSSSSHSSSLYAPPSAPSSAYAPPPGQPPPDPALNGPPLGGIPDDGRPTTTPVPGHPLLKEGKLLVYPIGHVCEKCLNTGYKASDPSNPCRKCWAKYAKPYAGALLYTTPWTTSPPAQSASVPAHLPPLSKNTFQRPLPAARAPHRRRASDTPVLPPRPAISPPPQQFPYPYQPPSPPARGLAAHLQNPLFRNPLLLPFTAPLLEQAQAQRPPPHVRIAMGGAPPGALVLRPGDARLGGRVCARCGGNGVVPYMVFDEVACEACGGVGRVFR